MRTHEFPNLSPSRAQALVCLKQFHDLHVLKIGPKQTFSQPFAYGSLVHETLKGAFDPRNSTSPQGRDIKAIAERAVLCLNYPDADLQTADLARCISAVEAYVAQEEEGGVTLAVEVFEAFKLCGGPLRPLSLSARFDRLLIRPDTPDHLVIRDYKTGAPGRLDMNGACIMLAIVGMRFKEYRAFSVEFDFLSETGLVERNAVSFAKAKAAWPELKERALRVYSATEFPPEPGEHCCRCPLRPECQPELAVELEDLDRLFGDA